VGREGQGAQALAAFQRRRGRDKWAILEVWADAATGQTGQRKFTTKRHGSATTTGASSYQKRSRWNGARAAMIPTTGSRRHMTR
jgi:hypothetical protein